MLALVVCDEADETAVLGLVAQRAGATVQSSPRLELALKLLQREPADILIVALRTGALLDTTRRIRLDTAAPLTVISPSRDEETLCRLYEAGADLVLTRPYSARLLIAQTRALLRRRSDTALAPLPTLQAGDVRLQPATRTVTIAGQPPRTLTPLESRLLYTLMTHPGQTIPTEALVEHVWGYGGEGSAELLYGLVSRLRNKVEHDPHEPTLILTVPGVGYVLAGES